MPWILVHQTWQIYSQSLKHRCLESHYTKPGRSNGRSTTHQLSIDALKTATPKLGMFISHQWSIDALKTATPNLADLLADLPPSIEHRCLEYCYTKFGRSIGRSTPQSIEHRCLEYCYTKLGRSTPSQLSIDALNTATSNLADLLADLSPINWAKMPWIWVPQTWQIYP